MKNDFQQLRERLDSDEEVYFVWWLEELYQSGYISRYSRAKEYELAAPEKLTVIKKMKTKSKEVEEHVFHGSNYTPDFKIQWTEKAKDVFVTVMSSRKKKETIFYCDDDLVTIVEIKGMFDRNNMIRLVTVNIKMMFALFGIIVHLVKMPDWFKSTFTPQRYLRTNKSGGKRSIKWNVIDLKTYTQSKCKIDTTLELFQ